MNEMIQLQPITTADTSHYAFMEKLLVTAFPKEEYRDLTVLRKYTDETNKYHNNLIIEDEKPIGLFTYWDFEKFYYVEHFAIDPTYRNSGYGRKVLHHVCQTLKAPIILEVEAPIEEMAKRRINFYKQQGFSFWEIPYEQPPYRMGDPYISMHLMAYGNLSAENDYLHIKNKIYKEVYQIG